MTEIVVLNVVNQIDRFWSTRLLVKIPYVNLQIKGDLEILNPQHSNLEW
jgi:hypothetical protein